MKERLYQFDFIRAVSALSVIAIHTTSSYILTNDIGYVWNQLMRYAVPMFLIISGFLLYKSDKNKGNAGYPGFLGKRFNKVVIPYILWSAVYTLYSFRGSLIKGLSYTDTVLYYFKHLLTGIDHLYFIVIILQMYLLYPIIKTLFKKGYGKPALLVSLLLTFYFQLASYMYNWGYSILPKKLLTYNYILFPCWIFYFILGMYLVIHADKWKSVVVNNKVNIAVAWAIYFMALLAEGRLTKTFESSMKPTIIIYSVITFFLFYLISEHTLKNRNTVTLKVITWISEQSFIIYLSHILIMRLVRAASYRIGFTNIWNSLSGMTLLFIVTVISTLIFTRIASSVPFVSWLGGVYDHKQKIPM